MRPQSENPWPDRENIDEEISLVTFEKLNSHLESGVAYPVWTKIGAVASMFVRGMGASHLAYMAPGRPLPASKNPYVDPSHP